MKHLIILVFFLLCSACCWAASVPSNYNLNVHVSSTRMVRHGDSPYYQNLTVTVDGKKYELESLHPPNSLLILGDYKARLVKDQLWTGPYDSYRVYEFLFSDNKKRQYVVVGQTE